LHRFAAIKVFGFFAFVALSCGYFFFAFVSRPFAACRAEGLAKADPFAVHLCVPGVVGDPGDDGV